MVALRQQLPRQGRKVRWQVEQDPLVMSLSLQRLERRSERRKAIVQGIDILPLTGSQLAKRQQIEI